MIASLDENNSQDHRSVNIIHKINELIEAYSKLTEEFYCSQAEEALKQVAVLEHTFGNHIHHVQQTEEMYTQPSTGGPIITMVDDRDN